MALLMDAGIFAALRKRTLTKVTFAGFGHEIVRHGRCDGEGAR